MEAFKEQLSTNELCQKTVKWQLENEVIYKIRDSNGIKINLLTTF